MDEKDIYDKENEGNHEALAEASKLENIHYTKRELSHLSQEGLGTEEEQARVIESAELQAEVAPNNQEGVAQPTSKQSRNKKNKKSNTFLLSMLAGIIGALLTLIIVVNVPYFQDLVFPNTEDTPKVETTSPNPVAVNKDSDGDGTLVNMVEDASKAIVGIVNYKETNNPFQRDLGGNAQAGTGSGVIFSVEGDAAFVVTNNHVIEDASDLEVSLENGETVKAELIGTDALTDIAVLKISSEHVDATLAFGDSDELKPGEEVIAIGNPLGLEFSRTVTQGIVSAVDRSINVKTSAGEWALDVIQTDAAINPGNSGGALLNMRGEVIGINSLKITSNGVEGLGFAIPSNDVIPLIEELIKNNEIERPYLGISMVELAQVPRVYLKDLPNEVTEGVVVTHIDPQSAAAQAGIEVEDIITEINGKEISSSHDLRKALYTDLKVGDTATFKVYKGSEMKEIDIRLTSNLQVRE